MTISPYGMVVIAASADALAGLRVLLSTLPGDFPLPVAVVQHWTRHAPGQLSDLLRCCTRLPVRHAEEGEPVLPGAIYLARPDSHLLVRPDGTFAVRDGRGFRYVRSSANPLFTSAALAMCPSIAVVLSGKTAGVDNGVRSIQAAGGIVIAQDPEPAKTSGAMAPPAPAGTADFVLPLAQIGSALVKLSEGRCLAAA